MTIIKYQKKVLTVSVSLINFDFRTGKNCYPQVFLEECKHVAEEKKMHEYITDEIEISSDEENSNKENSDEENFNEENYIHNVIAAKTKNSRIQKVIM